MIRHRPTPWRPADPLLRAIDRREHQVTRFDERAIATTYGDVRRFGRSRNPRASNHHAALLIPDNPRITWRRKVAFRQVVMLTTFQFTPRK